MNKEKTELIEIAAKDYLYYKNRDRIYNREPSESALITKGKFLGMLLALDLVFEENEREVIIKYAKSGRKCLIVYKEE